MELPADQVWLRVEQLADELGQHSAVEADQKMRALASAGEPTTVLTLLRSWLALPPPAAPIEAGCVIQGRYRIRQKLGEGGMGSVWRAHQLAVNRDVALKTIHPALITPLLQEKFLEEINVLGKLDHPGIVGIIDAGMHDQPGFPKPIPYFTMELVEGQRLDHWTAEHRRDWRAQLQLGASICAALQSAHDRGIVHRDLKPGNIMVKPDGQPVVLDFGIARLAGLAVSATGAFSGTPQYAAPEQHLGRDQDFRSGESVDVYALGAVLFEMVAGRRLFEFPRGTPIAEMRRAVLEGAVPRLQDVAPSCPEVIAEIVARAVRRDPADRFYSIAALGRALVRAVASLEATQPSPPPWTPRPQLLVPGTRWRLDANIGEGSVGQIWTATHDDLRTRRVFKFCATEEKARSLNREVTLFRLLKERVGLNPHFIQLHDVSLAEPPWYLMMEHVEAEDLEAWSAARPGGLANVPLETRIEIVAQTAEALQAAHEAGILHRDIKPANLLVRTEASRSARPETGSASAKPESPLAGIPATSRERIEPQESPACLPGLHVFIADFGIGQLVANDLLVAGTHLGFTRTLSEMQRTGLSGTMLYIAPEILAGDNATARSDIYSLGVLLWQLLIGNFHTALDPADWLNRVSDPFLREDLTRCLAGVPSKRWASAGELAASLRAIPARRAAEAKRLAELAARERRAYLRGVARAAAVAVAVIAGIAMLAAVAWQQRRAADKARGQIALEQAAGLNRTDFNPGRRKRGLQLVDTAAATVSNHAALRTAVASVMGMWDLVPASSTARVEQVAIRNIPMLTNESCRALSPDGSLLAVARDLDGLNGAVDLFDSATGKSRLTIQRQQFPWVPIAEPGLLRFSPDQRRLAIGGSATSRHLLLCLVADGSLQAYLFHGSDVLSCVWHPAGRLFVTGCADGTVRVWDTSDAANPMIDAQERNQFDLPPVLDAPALDTPVQIVKGHRGPVLHLAFSPQGRWLASLDGLGYLRVHTGFTREGLGHLPPPSDAGKVAPPLSVPDLNLVSEVRLVDAEQVSGLSARGDRLGVERSDGSVTEYEIDPSQLPQQLHVGPGLANITWALGAQQLCVISRTDIHWLSSSPLERFYTASGHNPMGVGWDAGDHCWLVAKDKQLVDYRPVQDLGAWVVTPGTPLPLVEAVQGQGARTAITTAGDGRTAVYYGRLIHFFARHVVAPRTSSLLAPDGGVLQELIWDAPGSLLAVTFRSTNGHLRLHSWSTSSNFPPQCHMNAQVDLDCQGIVPANDGRHLIARGKHLGLIQFDPQTQSKTVIDSSNLACQTAPLAATSNGDLLAIVVDANTVRLLTLPSGEHFADLRSPSQASLITLAWDTAGQNLAALTEDGYVLAWNLVPWLRWLDEHHLRGLARR
ncbi:MAG TPA: serine/threonine-protein kinase [Verrucomicrobiae bacterium]|nr:serine/threonine-protein kinase [Verrucomicrobiae bacterium]